MRCGADRRLRGLEHDGEALADADADRGEPPAAAATAQLTRERAEDAHARGAEGMADRDRAAVDVDDRGIKVRPLAQTGQRLDGERFIQLDDRQIAPTDPGASEGVVRSFDRTDPEDVRIDAGGGAAGDAGKRLDAEGIGR